MLLGRDDTALPAAGRSRYLRWWFLGAAASVTATAVLVKLAVDVVPRPLAGIAAMAAFLPVLIPTRYLRARARES